ncbi:AAA family ATPase [Kitasatospora sp. NPDC059571]|uniref:AAA family ATPase n=1 Tax=Kitasatospora sp. NPDC059571 TaxID=3346871 RepID=UPI00369EDDB7
MHETTGTRPAVEDGRSELPGPRPGRPSEAAAGTAAGPTDEPAGGRAGGRRRRTEPCAASSAAAAALRAGVPLQGGVPPQGNQPLQAGVPFQGGVLNPDGLHDLRHRPVPTVLRYPAEDLVAVTGLPGSGKSTLMSRCARAPLVDSQLVRERYEERLPLLPYALYRPLVRLDHYRGLRRALAGGGPLVVHDCGTLPWVRHWLARTAARQGRRLHLILLDATADQAVDGQLARGRTVSAHAFARHRRAAARLHAELSATEGPARDCASTVLLDRSGASRIRTVEFV